MVKNNPLNAQKKKGAKAPFFCIIDMFNYLYPDIDKMREYLINNYKTIRYRTYKGEYLSDAQVFVYVACYQEKIDSSALPKIFITNVAEAAFQYFTGQSAMCNKGNDRPFDRFKLKYKFCGTHCPCATKSRIETRTGKSEEEKQAIRERVKKTNIERTGYEHNMFDPQMKKRVQATNIELYGHACSLQSDVVKEKTKKTLLEQYGTTEPLSNPEIYEKGRKTRIEKYGHDYVATDAFRDKVRNTVRERYGVEHFFQSEEFKIKTEETNLRQHGTLRPPSTKPFGQYPNTLLLSERAREILLDENNFRAFMKIYSRNGAALDLRVDRKTISNYCEIYGVSLPTSRSTYETEMAFFLDSLGVKYSINDRTIIRPKELDFYLPDHAFAIEINGLYWHSDINPRYHQEKHLACRELGIDLLMINEDEILYHQDALKQHIKHRLGFSSKGIGARHTEIKKIPNPISFYEKHHIQGKAGNPFLNFGAFYQNTLVAAMSFSRQHGTGDIELIKFCNNGTNNPGVFSKILKIAQSELQQDIITFADLRYNTGNLYQHNGFVLESTIPPDYRYIKGLQIYHKSNFTLRKIARNFGIFDKTERIAMKELGYRRLYDCGKLKYIKKY